MTQTTHEQPIPELQAGMHLVILAASEAPAGEFPYQPGQDYSGHYDHPDGRLHVLYIDLGTEPGHPTVQVLAPDETQRAYLAKCLAEGTLITWSIVPSWTVPLNQLSIGFEACAIPSELDRLYDYARTLARGQTATRMVPVIPAHLTRQTACAAD